MGKLGVIDKYAENGVTLDELKQKFPAKRNTLTQESVDFLNEVMTDPNFEASTFLNHLVDYQSIMVDSSGSFTEYVNAMKFCAFLETDIPLVEAYKRARAKDAFVQDRWNAASGSLGYNEMASAASRYRKSSMVRNILTQTDLHISVMFQKERYKAVMVLANEMQTAAYSKDRIAAAEKLLTHVKPPETQQISIGVGLNSGAMDMQTQLFDQLAKISQAQRDRLVGGADIRDVQRIGINTEFVDVDAEDNNG